MKLFQATAEDVGRIEECARRCCEEHGLGRCGGPLNWPHYRNVLEDLLRGGGGRMWLHEDLGKIVGGFCGAVIVAPLTGLARACRVFVYVLPEYRGKLSILRLVRLYEAWARERDCTTAAMSWMDSMPEGTLRAYKALGYREQETMFLKDL